MLSTWCHSKSLLIPWQVFKWRPWYSLINIYILSKGLRTYNNCYCLIKEKTSGKYTMLGVLEWLPLSNTVDSFCHRTVYHLFKGCTRLAASSEKAYQLLAHGWWFSPDIPPTCTTNTGRHDIAEILLKVALGIHQSINQSIICICIYKLNNEICLFVEESYATKESPKSFSCKISRVVLIYIVIMMKTKSKSTTWA